jgi:hypothetical protein
MPNLTLITLTAPSLPVGYCPSSYQQLANDIIGGTQANFNSAIGNSFFNFGPTVPALNNQIYPWLDNNGFWWVFNGGYWARQNPVAAGSSERRIFVGTSTDVLSYDGGDGTVYSGNPYAGSMWQLDNAFDARFPVGVGAFAGSGAVAVQGTTTSTSVVGEDQHLLTTAEIPSHTHSMTWDSQDTSGGNQLKTLYFGPDANVPNDINKNTGSTGGDTAHNNLPPFYGVYFIKRTGRVYYTK